MYRNFLSDVLQGLERLTKCLNKVSLAYSKWGYKFSLYTQLQDWIIGFRE
jgi:hypothetical protein